MPPTPTPFGTSEGIKNLAAPAFGSGEGSMLFAQIMANVLKFSFSFALIILVIMLIWGGIQWMTAGESKEVLQSAQKKISGTILGFIVYMAAFAIINYIAPYLGLEMLNPLKITWPKP